MCNILCNYLKNKVCPLNYQGKIEFILYILSKKESHDWSVPAIFKKVILCGWNFKCMSSLKSIKLFPNLIIFSWTTTGLSLILHCTDVERMLLPKEPDYKESLILKNSSRTEYLFLKIFWLLSWFEKKNISSVGTFKLYIIFLK